MGKFFWDFFSPGPFKKLRKKILKLLGIKKKIAQIFWGKNFWPPLSFSFKKKLKKKTPKNPKTFADFIFEKNFLKSKKI